MCVMHQLSFGQLFSILFTLFVVLFLASQLLAWTGATTTPPGGNVDAPINVGTVSQIKNGTIGVNGLGVFGNAYVQTRLGIANSNPVVALHVNGTTKLGNGGEVCQAVTEGSIRYDAGSKTVQFCNGSAWVKFGTYAINLSFQDTTNSSTASMTMPEAAKGILTVYANVCVPNSQATVVQLKVNGVIQNSLYHRDASNSGGVTCTVETLTYHGNFSAGSHEIVVTSSQNGRFQNYTPTRDPAVQGYLLYPVN